MLVKIRSVNNLVLICLFIIPSTLALSLPEKELNPSTLGVKEITESSNSDKTPIKENSSQNTRTEEVEKTDRKDVYTVEELYRNCKDNLTCTEMGVIEIINEVDNKSISILQDVITIVKTEDEAKNEVPVDVEEPLIARVDRYLREHSIQVRLPKLEGNISEIIESIVNTTEAASSGRSDISEG